MPHSDLARLDRRLRFISLLAILFSTMACSNARTTLGTKPDPRTEGEMTFYRLDGDRYPGDPVAPGTELLHGYSAIEACGIEDRGTRAAILEAFDAGIADHDRANTPAVDCFRPRHAIRILQDGVTTDFLICLECRNWYSWTDGEPSGGGGTSDAPRGTFDRILDDCR